MNIIIFGVLRHPNSTQWDRKCCHSQEDWLNSWKAKNRPRFQPNSQPTLSPLQQANFPYRNRLLPTLRPMNSNRLHYNRPRRNRTNFLPQSVFWIHRLSPSHRGRVFEQSWGYLCFTFLRGRGSHQLMKEIRQISELADFEATLFTR